MPSTVTIRDAASPDDLTIVRALFDAYAASLPVDLAYQDFAAEVAGLPSAYAPPRGALLLARRGDAAIGCAALRGLGADGICEMKRLFVRDDARGLGLGRALAVAIIAAARDRGYAELRLDTLATMAAARALYARLGFARIAPYYAPTPPGTIFMALAL